MVQVTAHAASELHLINDSIHDRWFSVNDIERRPEKGELIIVFSNRESFDRRAVCSARGWPDSSALVVRTVERVDFKDSEGVLWYDFNRVRYHPNEGIVDILTNIPIDIQLHVRTLDVRVIQSLCEEGRHS